MAKGRSSTPLRSSTSVPLSGLRGGNSTLATAAFSASGAAGATRHAQSSATATQGLTRRPRWKWRPPLKGEVGRRRQANTVSARPVSAERADDLDPARVGAGPPLRPIHILDEGGGMQ